MGWVIQPALATILIAGVNLYALALVLKLMLGWPILLGIVVVVYVALYSLAYSIYILPAAPATPSTLNTSTL